MMLFISRPSTKTPTDGRPHIRLSLTAKLFSWLMHVARPWEYVGMVWWLINTGPEQVRGVNTFDPGWVHHIDEWVTAYRFGIFVIIVNGACFVWLQGWAVDHFVIWVGNWEKVVSSVWDVLARPTDFGLSHLRDDKFGVIDVHWVVVGWSHHV